MSETYFVTGAQGCIGSWVVKRLVERGDTPVVFDTSDDARRLEAILDAEPLSRVRFVRGDVTRRDETRDAIERSGASRVIHLAGLQVPICRADPVRGALVNVVGTLDVFVAALELGLPRVVYASSAAVYGAAEDGTAVDEASACEPATHYGVFKRANEENARIFYLDNGLSSVGLRPHTVYGVNRDFGLTSAPTLAMKSAVVGRPFVIPFGGATDFLYAADAAAAFIDAADDAPEGAHVFNLHGDTVAIADFVETIDAALPEASRGLVTFDGPPIPIASELDDAAFRRLVSRTPPTPLEAGVRETIDRFVELRESGRLDTRELDPPATGAGTTP